MRLSTLATASVVAAGWALAALVSARGLEDASPRGRPPLDPVASSLEGVAILVSLAAFLALGRHVGDRGRAWRAGALAGVLGGIAAGTAQALGLAGYLGQVLARYNVPEWFLAGVLVAYVALATGLMAVLGAGIAWGGARYLAAARGR